MTSKIATSATSGTISAAIRAAVSGAVSIVLPIRDMRISRSSSRARAFVLVDTPGIFAPKRRLERAMVAAAWAGAADADQVVVLIDAARGLDEEAQRIVDGLKSAGRRAVLALNKVDLVDARKLLPLTERLSKEGIFDAVFMISALSGDGVADLKRHLAAAVPVGPWLYPRISSPTCRSG